MAIIKVDTPEGIKKVEIAGDTPTQEEQQLILNTFFPETQGVRRQAGEIDLTTASVKEIREYNNLLRSQGIDPFTGSQISEEDFINYYKEPGVDYSSGVDDVEGFSRFQFGRMETDEEKSAYLTQALGT